MAGLSSNMRTTQEVSSRTEQSVITICNMLGATKASCVVPSNNRTLETVIVRGLESSSFKEISLVKRLGIVLAQSQFLVAKILRELWKTRNCMNEYDCAS